MKRLRRARVLVMDASVARASGAECASNAISIACRQALILTDAAGLWIVMSPARFDEWRRNASTFARKWLAKMVAKKSVKRLNPPHHERMRIAWAALAGSKAHRAIEKDLHLVEAALASDRRIVSIDEAACTAFGRLVSRVADLLHLHWVSPLAAHSPAWIQAGAPDDARFLLAVAIRN